MAHGIHSRAFFSVKYAWEYLLLGEAQSTPHRHTVIQESIAEGHVLGVPCKIPKHIRCNALTHGTKDDASSNTIRGIDQDGVDIIALELIGEESAKPIARRVLFEEAQESMLVVHQSLDLGADARRGRPLS